MIDLHNPQDKLLGVTVAELINFEFLESLTDIFPKLSLT